MDDIPEHKRYLWRPIEYQGDGIEVETTIHADRVVIRREPAPAAEPAPTDDTAAIIAALIAKIEQIEAKTDSNTQALAALAEEAVKE
jgi:hypothetical protein